MRAIVAAFVTVAALLLAGGARADERPPPREPLPLPAAGKPSRVTPSQRSFRVPLSFARVERFYRDRFAAEPGVTLTLGAGGRGARGRVLTLASRRPTDAWLRAVVHEGEVDTSIEVTPVVRLQAEVVAGRPIEPLVHFVLPVNPEVARQAASLAPSPTPSPPPAPARR